MNDCSFSLSLEQLNQYRADTFRTRPGKNLKSIEEAIEYVNQRGFIFFWPMKGMVFPSLWTAAAGNRPVADEHDDPGHITWGWKDNLLGKKQWFYSRLLCSKNTILSLSTLPFFYALSPNYGDPESDYLFEYQQGYLTMEARVVYEALLEKGPLDTIQLRKAARLSSPENSSRFNRALTDLQRKFRVVPCGISDSGAWHYSFIYDVVHRQFPELIDQCRFITDKEARKNILTHYMNSLGAASLRDIRKVLGWETKDITTTLEILCKENFILPGVNLIEPLENGKRNSPQKQNDEFERLYCLAILQ